ncbi:hypothetical protein AB0M46_11045 [Dactylosporangium sp. NPDC051485]|uniref:hypothetical protein n=1 Tax=Dactylosporangium sp. NPDC051485 TaxID=3154846 RepID=UPI00344560D9
MTTDLTVEQEPAAGSAGAVTDEQLIAMLVERARGDGLRTRSSSQAARERRRMIRRWSGQPAGVLEG